MTRSVRHLIVGSANTIHDPAMCIIEDDRVFCESLERHMQCKRAWEGNLYYSARAVKSALTDLGLWPVPRAEIELLTSWNVEGRQAWKSPEKLPLAPVRAQAEHIAQQWRFEHLLQSILSSNLASLEARGKGVSNFRIRGRELDHHLSHAANACLTSVFDECVVMILDGFGEESGSSFYHFKNNEFTQLNDGRSANLAKNIVTGSFGTAYAIVTNLCGFSPSDGEEWKVMGLAAYGEYDPEIYGFFREKTNVNGLCVSFEWANTRSLAELEAIVGGFRRVGEGDVVGSAKLAHNFQLAWENALLELTGNLSRLGLSKNLAYGGGCALNSTTNGKILTRTSFEALHIPSAPADDGNALGVALFHKHCVMGMPRVAEVFSPYLGSTADVSSLERILSFEGIRYEVAANDDSLCQRVAELLSEGAIVGWMQGRAEFGPRALGNRSIVADPRSAQMKNRINQRIKFREEYRPIAPSILAEKGSDFFIDFQESPYMERTLYVKPEVRKLIPAAVHVDGTARLHTVTIDNNPLYYKLIENFMTITGVPVVINTSLNVMGKPIVHSVEDAVSVFYTTGLDAIAIDRYILLK